MKIALDRDLQRTILQDLANLYPERDRMIFHNKPVEIEQAYRICIAYLHEHGLVLKDQIGVKITAKGMDFLADDGGLSAILGVVTIKLHDDTLRSLIEEKIQGADLNQPEKQKMLARLQSLPADAIKHLTMKLLDKGVESSPAVLALIGTALA